MATVLFLGIVAFVLSHFAWWRFERSLNQHCDARAVQRWAADFRRDHGRDAEYYAETKGTNLPPGIVDVLGFKPLVLYDPGSDYVTISWMRGDPCMLVGPSNFVYTDRLAHVWIPGVYLIEPRE
jgi:hypothetical protein